MRPYPELLALRHPGGVLSRCVDGGTILDLERMARRTLREDDPRAVVLQMGIVDCAPRPLTDEERDRLSRLRPEIFRRAVIRLLHVQRRQVIRWRGLIQRTPLALYAESFRRILEACYERDRQVAVLPIFPATTAILARNPRLALEIDTYNAAMRATDGRPAFFDAATLFRGLSADAVAVRPESVHLNQLGHERLAEALASWIAPLAARGEGKARSA